MSSKWVIVALITALALVSLPACAQAASSTSFDDPIGDTPEFAADLGATTVTVGDDSTIVVDTRIAPRPAGYWGGCSDSSSAQACGPPEVSLTWYLDYSSGSGSSADHGADAKVVAVPSGGRTVWRSERWNAVAGRFSAGAEPVASGDPEGATWTLGLDDLGVPRSATIRVWAVSLYASDDGLGAPESYSDRAGPGTVSVVGQAGSGVVVARSCARAIGAAGGLQRRLGQAKQGRSSAKRRQVMRLRARHRRVVQAMNRLCDASA